MNVLLNRVSHYSKPLAPERRAFRPLKPGDAAAASTAPRFSGSWQQFKWLGLPAVLLSVLPLGIKLSAPNQPEPAKTVPVKSPAPQPETHYVPGRQLGFDEYVDLSQKVADAGENKNRAIMSTQRNLNRKLQKELMPAVKAILNPANPPAEIVLGSDYSSPEWNEVTMDDGRGLPVAYRYRLNVSADPAKPDIRKMSLITFLEYHPQRQRFEVVNAQDGVVNDAVRILIETEPKQSGEKRGFIGASFQVKVNQGEVVDIQPITYFTEQGEVAPANPRGKEMPEVLSPAHCIECHGREDDYFFRMNFEQQRTSYQPGQTVDRFINAMTKKGVPADQLKSLRACLENPLQNRQRLIPPGLFQTVCQCCAGPDCRKKP